MLMPVRIQLKCDKGFNLKKLSKEINGLEAVKVSKPSKWGNRFRVGELWDNKYPVTEEQAAGFYKKYILPFFTQAQLEEIRGKNLACWCPLTDEAGNRVSCHASVLLEIANE